MSETKTRSGWRIALTVAVVVVVAVVALAAASGIYLVLVFSGR